MDGEVISKDQKRMIAVKKLIENRLENECPNCGSNLFEIVKEVSVKGRFDLNKFSKPRTLTIRVNCASCFINLIEIDENGHIDLNPLI